MSRYRIKTLGFLRKELHGAEGALIEKRTITPSFGEPFGMIKIKLDSSIIATDEHGCFIFSEVELTEDCFEEVQE